MVKLKDIKDKLQIGDIISVYGEQSIYMFSGESGTVSNLYSVSSYNDFGEDLGVDFFITNKIFHSLNSKLPGDTGYFLNNDDLDIVVTKTKDYMNETDRQLKELEMKASLNEGKRIWEGIGGYKMYTESIGKDLVLKRVKDTEESSVMYSGSSSTIHQIKRRTKNVGYIKHRITI